jgi:hypothetical protein
MSRKGMTKLSTAPPVELDRRLRAPEDLTPEQAHLWDAITATKPGDWFQADCAALLAAYVRHTVSARVIDEKIDSMESSGFEDAEQFMLYEKLLNMREKQTKVLLSTATKLRLAPQSRYDAQMGGVHARKHTKKLWDQ